MKITTTSLLLSLVILSGWHWAARTAGQEVNEQINKTITLAPGSDVSVRGINGPVTVETGEGDQAEIDIKIRAASREAIERKPLSVENTPNSLTIRTVENKEGRRGDHEWVRHEVHLKLPRNVSMNISGVNGAVDVGPIEGGIVINGINGRVDVAQAGTATKLSGINGGIKISLARLGEGGLHVSGINGGVEIGFPTSIDADIDVTGVNGSVDSDLPITLLGEMKRGQLKGTIGAGGKLISISGINGGVKLRRN
ncbi:MAG: hypothetical protein J2P41_08120 [Blastocatellia bacterium]|nr:hypothetical protein [Blastocatellia bacterium]